jgi:hypothetical protein
LHDALAVWCGFVDLFGYGPEFLYCVDAVCVGCGGHFVWFLCWLIAPGVIVVSREEIRGRVGLIRGGIGGIIIWVK